MRETEKVYLERLTTPAVIYYTYVKLNIYRDVIKIVVITFLVEVISLFLNNYFSINHSNNTQDHKHYKNININFLSLIST